MGKMKKEVSERIISDELYPKLSEIYYWEADVDRGPGEWYYYVQVGERDYHITYSGMSIGYTNLSRPITNRRLT